jgi:hypothetical protein
LVRRPGQATLLELPGHGEEALDQGGQRLARHRATPRIGPRAPVCEDAASGNEPFLSGRAELGESLELRIVEHPLGKIELRLDVCLLGSRPEIAGIAGRTEQESDGLREDRLARAGLPRDRVEARREGEVRLADEDEALDVEASQHPGRRYGKTSL